MVRGRFRGGRRRDHHPRQGRRDAVSSASRTRRNGVGSNPRYWPCWASIGCRLGATVRCLAHVLERLTATAPVVMVFGLRDFADSGLLGFVDHLLEWSRAVPIDVITLVHAPSCLKKRPHLGAGKRSFSSLYLEPLTEASMHLLLGGPCPGCRRRPGRHRGSADGIPLYAVETVRMLLQGRLALEGGAYRPVGVHRPGRAGVATALIASRLDGLAPDDRALVSDAAVLGRRSPAPGSAPSAAAPKNEAGPGPATLVRRGSLVILEADPRSAQERGQYAFVQALVQEVPAQHAPRSSIQAPPSRCGAVFEGARLR